MLLAVACFILSTGVGAVLSPGVVPIELDIPGLETLGVEGARQALQSTMVSFCAVSWDLRRTSPSLVPMYRDLVKSSPGCDESSVVRVPWGTLEEEYRSRGCGVGGGGTVPPPGCVPTGLVFHQSRCGSTLVGNLLASLPDSLGYSEAAPPLELLTSPSLRDLPQEELAAALRVLVAAMGRPAAGGGGGGGATAPPLFLKLQSTLSLTLPMWRLAFPAVPWAFVHREGVAVLASLLRGSSSPPSPQSPPSVHLSWDDAALTTSPCLRAYAFHGKGGVGEPHATLLGGSDPVASRLSPEEACAAHAGLLAASALSSAMDARTQGFARLSPPLVLATPGEGSSLLALPPHAGVSVVGGSEGLVVVGGGGEAGGVVGGIGQGIMVDYSTLPDFALTVIQGHFGFMLSPTTRGALMGEAKLYSKARGATGGKEGGGGKGGHQQQQRVGLGEGGVYVEDTEAKSSIAWPALEGAAAKYMATLHTALKAFNPTATALQGGGGGALGLDGASQPVAGGVDGGGVSVNPSATASLLPLGGGYPALFPLSEMLRVWNPDITLPPPSYGSFSSLRVFNFSSPPSLAEALKYRRAELPFLMRGIPSLDATVKAWGEDKYLEGLMGGDELVYPCEVSSGQHFMYFNKAKAGKMRGYVPPTSEGHLSITKWLARAHESLNITRGEERRVLGLGEGGLGGEEEGVIGDFLLQQQALPPRPTQPLPPQPTIARTPREMHYLRASTNQRDKSANAWVWDALAFLRSDEDSPYGRASAPDVTTPTATALEWPFFLVDASNQRGIHCRFGMGGIIAESHSDAGRNFITMERGHKRYILSPPEECSRLSILSDGPSARHSSLDWSSLEGIGALGAAGALATEVILAPGDALYVPAGWFHFIMSLDTNVQCNTRSGTPPLHEDILGACGIAPPVTENMGDFIDPQAPALQPFREAHGKLWGSKWPLPLQSGAIPLPEAYKDALPLNPPTLAREPLPPPLSPPSTTTGGGGGIPLGRFLEAFPPSSVPPSTTTPAISTVAPITPPVQNPLVPPIPVMLPKSAKGPPPPLTPPIKPATVVPIKALDTTVSTTTTTTTAVQGGQAPPAPVAPTTGDSFAAVAAPKTDPKGVVVGAEPFNPVSTTTSSTPSTPTIVTPPTPFPSDTPPSSLFTPLNLIVIMVFAGVVVGGATAYVGRSKSSGGGVWETLNTSTLSASERAKQLMARGKGLRASISAILPNTSSWRKRVYQESQSPLPLAADLVRVKGSDGIV